MVTVFSKPGCGACVATRRALDKGGVEYRLVDVSVDAEAREMLVSRGFTQMPVVDPGDGREWFSGFRLDRVRALTR